MKPTLAELGVRCLIWLDMVLTRSAAGLASIGTRNLDGTSYPLWLPFFLAIRDLGTQDVISKQFDLAEYSKSDPAVWIRKLGHLSVVCSQLYRPFEMPILKGRRVFWDDLELSAISPLDTTVVCIYEVKRLRD